MPPLFKAWNDHQLVWLQNPLRFLDQHALQGKAPRPLTQTGWHKLFAAFKRELPMSKFRLSIRFTCLRQSPRLVLPHSHWQELQRTFTSPGSSYLSVRNNRFALQLRSWNLRQRSFLRGRSAPSRYRNRPLPLFLPKEDSFWHEGWASVSMLVRPSPHFVLQTKLYETRADNQSKTWQWLLASVLGLLLTKEMHASCISPVGVMGDTQQVGELRLKELHWVRWLIPSFAAHL